MAAVADAKLRPHWAPRLPMAMVRRLYESEAGGLLDEELLDDAGTRLYLRCESIALVRRIQHERVVYCEDCDEFFPREAREPGDVVACPNCARSAPWREYWATLRHRELAGTPELLGEFMSSWQRARSPSEKMLAIDRAIHRWHHENDPERGLGRPWGVNLIEGSRKQVIEFLERLSDGPNDARLVENHRRWREGLETVRESQARWSRTSRRERLSGD